MQGTPHPGPYPASTLPLVGTPTAEGVASAEAQAAAAAALASQYASMYAAADESDVAHSSKWQLLFQTQSEMASRLAEMATAMRRQLSLAQSHNLGLSPGSSVGQDSSKQTPFFHPLHLPSHDRRTRIATSSIATPSVMPLGASAPGSSLLSKQTHPNQHSNRSSNQATQQNNTQERFICPQISCDKTYATKKGLHDHLKKGASAHSSATPSTSHALSETTTDPAVDSEHEQPPHSSPVTAVAQRTPHPYACPDPSCGRSWHTSKSLLKHLKDFSSHAVHVSLAPPVRAAAIASGRKTSVAARAILSSVGDKPISYVCTGCDKEFSGAHNLKRHFGRFPSHDVQREYEEEEHAEKEEGEYDEFVETEGELGNIELVGEEVRRNDVDLPGAEADVELQEDIQVELENILGVQQEVLMEGKPGEDTGLGDDQLLEKKETGKDYGREQDTEVQVAAPSMVLAEVPAREAAEEEEADTSNGMDVVDESKETKGDDQAGVDDASPMEDMESAVPRVENGHMDVDSRTDVSQELAAPETQMAKDARQISTAISDTAVRSANSDYIKSQPVMEPTAALEVHVAQKEDSAVVQHPSVSDEQQPAASVSLFLEEDANTEEARPDASASSVLRADSEGSISRAASRASSVSSANTRRRRTKLPCPDLKCRQTFSNDDGLRWHLVHYPQHTPRGVVMGTGAHGTFLLRPNNEDGDDYVSVGRESAMVADDAEPRGRWERRVKAGSSVVAPTVGVATEKVPVGVDLHTDASASAVVDDELETASALATLAESAASQLPVAGDVGSHQTNGVEMPTVTVSPETESTDVVGMEPSLTVVESVAALSAAGAADSDVRGVINAEEAAQHIENAASDNEDESASNKAFLCPHPDCGKSYKYASGLEFHLRANVHHRPDGSAENLPREQDGMADKALFNFTVMGLASASSASQPQRESSNDATATVVPRFPPDSSKPYACPIPLCGKGYVNKGALSRHMNAGKHGVYADTGRRKSRRIVEDADAMAARTAGTVEEEDEAEVTVDEDEDAPPTKRVRAGIRITAAEISAADSALAYSASAETEQVSLDTMVNGGMNATIGECDSNEERQSIVSSNYKSACAEPFVLAPAVVDASASASPTPSSTEVTGAPQALVTETTKVPPLRKRSRPTLAVNTPNKPSAPAVSRDQTYLIRSSATPDQPASSATTAWTQSISEAVAEPAEPASTETSRTVASIAPAAESISSSDKRAQTTSDVAVNPPGTSSSEQANYQSAATVPQASAAHVAVNPPGTSSSEQANYQSAATVPQASAAHASAFTGSVNKKRKGRSATPMETEQPSKLARSAADIGHASRPDPPQVQPRFETEFPTIATLDELDAVFCDHEAQKAALSQLAASTPSLRPETRSHSATQVLTHKPFSAPMTRSARAGAASASHMEDTAFLDALMGERPEVAESDEDDDDSPFECEPGITPTLGSPRSGWHYNLKFGAIVEAYSKSCRLWYPARVMYYIITDKNTYKLKLHYIGYTKKFDEIFDLLLPERRAQIRPTVDDAASKKKEAPARGVDKAKAAIQGVDFEEDSAMWELGDAAAPADLEGVLYEGVDAAAKRIGDFLVMDEDMEPSKKRK
ncbi:hypothetical protein BC830DRAFT_1170757 [Chytriomyces sp. MP71]|nr:hypothetical protein BC830DRAFT_1170757 [Chytriomyces sp. MP71]